MRDARLAMIVATVCGGADGVWQEYRQSADLILSVLRPGERWTRLACNDAGVEHPDALQHWCTLHHEKMEAWKARRTEAGFRVMPTTWGVAARRSLDELQRVWKGGSSGLLCVDVALHRLGANAVILCGVPMNDDRNRFTGQQWGQWTRYWPDWQKARAELEGRVKSWSGRTREMLGEPTIDWLRAVHEASSGAGSDAA